jgi:phage minor structural protein
MIKVYNQQFEAKAILENAFDIGYSTAFNELWDAHFSMPLTDPKVNEITALSYVEIFDNDTRVDLFRIIPNEAKKDNSGQIITYQCEHVLATLLDDSLFQYHQVSNLPTIESLQYVMDQQTTKHWQLGEIAFERYFAYKWENENLLSALFSVPRPFDEVYHWTWDTSRYPWTLNLVEPSEVVTGEIRYGKNMKGITRYEDPSLIVTRLYALGYGEGTNQLRIDEANPTGLPYIDADTQSLYGVRTHIFVDKRFENAESLYNTAKGSLEEWKVPKITYAIDLIDLEPITEHKGLEKFNEGDLIRVVDEDFGTFTTRVVKKGKPDTTGTPHDIKLEIANKLSDLGTTLADTERRQRINELYAQGATNLSGADETDNTGPNHPVILRFRIPEEMVNVNKSLLSFQTTKFRTYMNVTKGGGGSTTTAGGGTTKTTNSVDNHRHLMFSGAGAAHPGAGMVGFWAGDSGGQGIPINLETPDVSQDLYTYSADGGHSHSLTLSDHSHTVPEHSHEIDHDIYELSTLPDSVTVKVDGNTVPDMSLNETDVDIIPYLAKDSNGKVKRDWHSIEISTNTLGRVSANVINQFFIQSRGNYTL